MTLVIKRKKGQSFRIGDSLVMVLDVGGGEVKLGIDAPEDVDIVRGELEDTWQREKEGSGFRVQGSSPKPEARSPKPPLPSEPNPQTPLPQTPSSEEKKP